MPGSARRSRRIIGEGRSALQTTARTNIGGGGGDLHRSASFRPPNRERANWDKFWKPFGMACSRFPNAIMIFLGDFPRFGISTWSATLQSFEGDGADGAGVIGLIRQGFVRVGLEADQPDRDLVSSDQGFLIGRSGCDRSDHGHLSSALRKGRHANPDTLAFLARTPTRKRFPHSTVYECLKAFFRHASVFKTHRHAAYHCLKEVQKPFRHASVFKTRVSTRGCPFLKRAFLPI